jgi:hypothetical protein
MRGAWLVGPMIVPVRDQAAQQIGTPQKRTVGRRPAAEHEVVATAGAGVAAIEHELFAGQARLARLVIQQRRLFDQLIPVRGRLDVDLDDSRVWRHHEGGQPRIVCRRIPFEHHPQAEGCGGRLDGGDELEVIVSRRHRRHEDVEHSVAGFRADGGPHGLGRRLES